MPSRLHLLELCLGRILLLLFLSFLKLFVPGNQLTTQPLCNRFTMKVCKLTQVSHKREYFYLSVPQHEYGARASVLWLVYSIHSPRDIRSQGSRLSIWRSGECRHK